MSKLQRLRDNIAALSHALTSTSEYDKGILNKYSGFGGLGFILNPLDNKMAWTKSDTVCYEDTVRLFNLLKEESGSEKEYNRWVQSLKSSVLTAFYTPEELVKGLMNTIFGVLSPKFMLDPAAGMGVFMDTAKDTACDKGIRLNVTAFEKDLMTGTLLNCKRDKNTFVYVDGFENFPTEELGMYDLVATNVPFGNIEVYDPAYTNNDDTIRCEAAKMIHRYYVMKGLDCLRDGGILAYIITSNYINNDVEQLHNALREARLVGAYRLANNLFKENGTEVGTDLIVLQKDTKRGELTDAECMLLASYSEQGCPTNYYFTCYPEHVIATSKMVSTDAYGKPGLVYYHEDGVKGIAEQMGNVLAEDMRKNVSAELFDANHVGKITENQTTAIPKAERRMTKKEKALKAIYECYTQLYEYEQTNLVENAELRSELKKLYYSFMCEYGCLNGDDNKPVVKRVAKELLGLEYQGEDFRWMPSDIFFHPIAFGVMRTKLMTAHEALAASLNEYGKPDINYMSDLTGMDEETLFNELDGELFFNPVNNGYEIKAAFVNGNVIEKLEDIRQYNVPKPKVERSIKALEAAIPAPIPFEDLDFNLGERWVDASVYGRFASDFFSMPEKPGNWRSGAVKVTVKYQPLIDQFSVSADSHNEKIWTQYSVRSEASKDLNGIDLFTHALHNSCPKMMKFVRDERGWKMQDENGNYIKEEDAEKTQLANTKIEEIRQAYVEWLQREPKEFRDALAESYNRRFNCFVRPKYDGSHQTFPGLDMAALKEKYGIERLYDSQKDCIWMLKLNGGGICDHEVGSGKTLIMCIAAHEMKRLGLVHKPMIIGLKANVSAIAETYQTAYPNARILFAKESDYSASNRVDFFNRMKNNNWDCIIMSHDQFGKIPQSLEVQKEIMMDEIQQLESALEAVSFNEGWEIRSKQRKGLEVRKRNMEVKLLNLINSINNSKDSVVDFAMMGIDHIFVDESHQFKNLGFSTRHDRVAGIGNTEGSKRAYNLLMAIRTIQGRTGRDLGATFLSGTTVTNSLTELYALFRYLRPNALEKQRITCFDAWAAIFTKKSQEFEFGITNQIQLKERFRYFIKVPELAMFYNEITDFRTADDVGIERPKKHAMLLNIKPTPDQEEFIKTLMEFAKTGNFSLIGMPFVTDKQRKAKMLYATDMARKMSLDMRLIDPQYGDHPNNKASRCAELIARYYNAFNKQKGTQLVFSDLSTYQGSNGPWNVYSEIKRKLISEYGIRPNEIRFIQECKTDKAKQQMIKDVNDGKIRVLFGSTSMLGTGVNAQKRVVCVHHLDTPWRPSDLEQRDGRAIRKGNEIASLYADNKVDVIIYAVERSLDSYKFNLLHCKQTFINQLKRGQLAVRTLDEGDMDEKTGMNFSEYMAILSGNTDLLERAKLEKKIAALEGERKNFYRQHNENEQKQTTLQSDNERLERSIKAARQDLAVFEKVRRTEASGLVYNDLELSGFSGASELCGDDRIAAFGKELQRIDREVRTDIGEYRTIGTIYGFPFMLKTVQTGTLDGKPTYENRYYVKLKHLTYQQNGGKMSRLSYRLSAEYPLGVLQHIPSLIAQWEEKLEGNTSSLLQLSTILSQTWGKETQLAKFRSDLSALDRKINEELRKSETPQQPARQAA